VPVDDDDSIRRRGIHLACDYCHFQHSQFSYYLLILAPLLAAARIIGIVYIDFACKIKKTWSRYIEDVLTAQESAGQLPPGTCEHLQDIKLHVNWMHGAGHTLECQVEHSGRYQQGAGRRVGEQPEQLWALFKVRESTVLQMCIVTLRVY
jgi:hypothetical protein